MYLNKGYSVGIWIHQSIWYKNVSKRSSPKLKLRWHFSDIYGNTNWKRTDTTCWTIQTHSNELNWARHRINPGRKSLGQYCNIHIFSVISRFPLNTVHPFRNFLEVLPPRTLYKVETRKKLHASNIVCGVRGVVGPMWIGKRSRNAKVSQDFCPWV